MATFQRKTLRNLTPLAREIAEAINETDAVKRRLIRLMEHMLTTEVEAQALRNKFPRQAYAITEGLKHGGKKLHNYGRQTLAEIDADFHDPAPLERRALGE